MPFPQISPIIDFTVVDTHNPLTIGIADTSFYPSNFSIINPVYEITPPSFPKVVLSYTPRALSIFNSNDLNITCTDDPAFLATLPDGVWMIKQSISPPIDHNKEGQFMRTTQIRQKLGRAFLQTDITQCDMSMRREQVQVIEEIKFYIEGSEAAANRCNNTLATQMYRLANQMLDNFLRHRCRGTNGALWC